MIDKYFLEVFDSVPRQGPGSNIETAKAFSFLSDLPKKPAILDIGCGKGVQSIELASLSNGHITAMDMHKPFLKALQENISNKKVQEQITCLVGDMAELPFLENEFDAIWAEGSMFIIGYKQALKEWKKHIKANGYLVFSDCVWLKDNPPQEIIDYWKEEEIGLLTINEMLEAAKSEGYKALSNFTLAKSSWKKEFYDHIEQKLVDAKEKYSTEEDALKTFAAIDREIEMFDKYNAYFGYEFFVLQKI